MSQSNSQSNSQSQGSSSNIPTQTQFMQHGMSTVLAPEDLDCSICLAPLASEPTVAKLNSCPKCYFHTDCITSWFDSTHERRATCPNDRTVLFVPDPPAVPEYSREANQQQFNTIRTHFRAFVLRHSGQHNPQRIIANWTEDVARGRLDPARLPHVEMRRLTNEAPDLTEGERQARINHIMYTEIWFFTLRDRYIDAFRTSVSARLFALQPQATRIMANENVGATQDEALVRYFSNFDDKVEMMLALIDTREWSGYGEISTHINLLEMLAAIVLNPTYVRP